MSWDGTRPWVVAAAGPSAWMTVTAALAATGGDRVAVVVAGPADADLLRSVASAVVVVPVAARADDVVRIAEALLPAHDRVLVTAPGGLMAPLGGFTLADVAWALRAPVVVAADPGAANDVRLTLEVLERRHVPAAVVAVEPGDGPTDDWGDLPVALAGRIPAGAAELPDFAERAAEWLDPPLNAPTVAAPPRRAGTGKRIAIALLILIVTALQVLYMNSVYADDPPRAEQQPRHAFVEAGTAYAIPPPVVAQSAVPVPAGCGPARSSVTPTVPDAATTARVNAAWSRIEAALGAKAPLVAASLRPGATADALAAAQARMAVPYPADLVASLLRHDGAASRAGFEFPPFYRYIGLDASYAAWSTTCRIVARIGFRGDWWHRSHVPFAEAGDGGYLVVDARPGMGGRVGDYYAEAGTSFDKQPRSLTELLEAVAASLETGAEYAGYRPVVLPDGTLDWAN
jgi:cell wall assembly regulator SMI1